MSFKEKIKRFATTNIWVSRIGNPFRNKRERYWGGDSLWPRLPIYDFLGLSTLFCLMAFAFIFMTLEQSHEVPFLKYVSLFCVFIFLILLVLVIGLVYTLIISYKKTKKLKQLLIVMAVGQFFYFVLSSALLVFFTIGFHVPTIILVAFIVYIITDMTTLVCNIVFIDQSKTKQRICRLLALLPLLSFIVALIDIVLKFPNLILFVLILLVLSLLHILTFNNLAKRVLTIFYIKDIKEFEIMGRND